MNANGRFGMVIIRGTGMCRGKRRKRIKMEKVVESRKVLMKSRWVKMFDLVVICYCFLGGGAFGIAIAGIRGLMISQGGVGEWLF